MEEDKKVENPQDTTQKTEEGVKVVLAPEQETDLEAVLLAKEEEINRLRRDNKDYKAGMLSWKKKAKKNRDEDEEEDFDEEESNDDRMRRIIREEMAQTDLARANAEKEEIIKKIIRENKEIKTALKNKAQISNLPGGSSQESSTGEGQKNTIWTKEQLDYFKSKGIDPKKVADNWQKTK